MKISDLLAATLLAVGLASSGLASAVSVGFSKFTSNGNTDVSSQFLMDVSEGTSTATGETGVLFKFTNDVGIASSITQIYFDLGVAPSFGLASMAIDKEVGVDFSITDVNSKKDKNWPNVPGGETISFTADVGTGADANQPPPLNGINAAGDSLTLFALLNPGSFQNLLDALDAGTFRIAMHVQAIGTTGGSDSYINTVPLPAAAWLFGSALLGFVSFSVRRKA